METPKLFDSSTCPIDMPPSSKWDNYSARKNPRISLDAGYESLLSTSSSSNSNSFYMNTTITSNVMPTHFVGSYSTSNGGLSSDNFSSDDSNSVIFSQPCTPVKGASIYNCNNSVRTPDHKQQLVADVSSYYFASLRASGSTTKNDNCCFGQYSASNSNSPIKFNLVAQSPKFIVNPDNYINQRDSLTSKLLRSPAFKVSSVNTACQQQPVIKSFSSRFDTLNTPKLIVEEPTRTTPTEEEFMELLFKNKHLPSNPEFLIGRHMGIEQIDILSELSKRSMENIMDKIFENLTDTVDIVRVGCVNREWRQFIRSNKMINRKRVEFLRERQQIFETNKENRVKSQFSHDVSACAGDMKPTLFSTKTLEEKRNLLKSQFRARLLGQSSNGTHGSNSSLTSLDPNCLNNLSSSNMYSPALSSAQYMQIDDDNYLDESSFYNRSSLSKEINTTSGSLLNSGKSQLERKFKQISIEDSSLNQILRNKLPRTTSDEKISTTAFDIVNSSPKFIAKNLKLSPNKNKLLKTNSCNVPSTTKIDLIGSKTSKKNLKRL